MLFLLVIFELNVLDVVGCIVDQTCFFGSMFDLLLWTAWSLDYVGAFWMGDAWPALSPAIESHIDAVARLFEFAPNLDVGDCSGGAALGRHNA